MGEALSVEDAEIKVAALKISGRCEGPCPTSMGLCVDLLSGGNGACERGVAPRWIADDE